MLSSSNGGKEVSPSRVKSYLNKFSQDEKISTKKKVARNTVLRIDLDNSLRSTTRYLMTTAVSNFIEVKIPQDHPANKKLGTDGPRKFVGMIQDAFGKDVGFYPIHRIFLASTDDTTLFISTRKLVHICKDNDMLFSSVHDKKSQMYYKKLCDDDDDDENAKGMHFKRTFTITGKGKVFNPYVTVSGLTERELPSN